MYEKPWPLDKACIDTMVEQMNQWEATGRVNSWDQAVRGGIMGASGANAALPVAVGLSSPVTAAGQRRHYTGLPHEEQRHPSSLAARRQGACL